MKKERFFGIMMVIIAILLFLNLMDYHIFSGQAPAKPPVIPGHEFTGMVRSLRMIP